MPPTTAVSQADEEQAIVLLKNDGNLLPLAPNVRRIVIIGGHADKGVLAGSGSSLVYPRGGNAVPGLAADRLAGTGNVLCRRRRCELDPRACAERFSHVCRRD